jgi:hypothetical protein
MTRLCLRLHLPVQVAAELYDTTHFGSGVGFLIMSMCDLSQLLLRRID